MSKPTIHCFFEQHNSFRDACREMGCEALSYDLPNTCADWQGDLFAAFDDADFVSRVKENDVIFAFFPCTYFANTFVNMRMRKKRFPNWEKRMKEHDFFARKLEQMFRVFSHAHVICENPFSSFSDPFFRSFLRDKNICKIMDRTTFGDIMKKPTVFFSNREFPLIFPAEYKSKKVDFWTIIEALGANVRGAKLLHFLNEKRVRKGKAKIWIQRLDFVNFFRPNMPKRIQKILLKKKNNYTSSKIAPLFAKTFCEWILK